MKNILLIILSFTIISCNSQKKQSYQLNVLFIGNSLTYFYDMPQTLQKMLDETNPNIKIDQMTNPGQSLSGHLTDIVTLRTENGISVRKKKDGEITETEIKLKEKKWDIIILQTGTVSVLIPENRELKVNKAVLDIKDLADNPNCEFILFNTWPSKKEYPKQYCYESRMIDISIEKDKCCSPKIENLEQEIKLINESYDLVAEKNGIKKSDNGTKYYEILTEYPDIELYDDDSHPNANGSFLNACVFYKMLTHKKATDLKYIGAIESKTAELLKRIAE
ncbi:DUF4886 domain-containing protein [Maribacter sp. MAR_2009_72]|uniref:DUF4886 domain-containing protein n=1 Tax=Maribacter sp. MAR_2009_72 TaxID=1250050 RepID=UPI001199004D|nr:DUF4886 domain-containing protein [Maribacter sp. MAR_2009_72]TVZ15432.1 hypothetical protein JM81_1675 [Maribacter sp. MAR_2009_72]